MLLVAVKIKETTRSLEQWGFKVEQVSIDKITTGYLYTFFLLYDPYFVRTKCDINSISIHSNPLDIIRHIVYENFYINDIHPYIKSYQTQYDVSVFISSKIINVDLKDEDEAYQYFVEEQKKEKELKESTILSDQVSTKTRLEIFGLDKYFEKQEELKNIEKEDNRFLELDFE